MEILLVCLYILLLSLIIYKSSFFESQVIKKKYLLIFFWIKILAGLSLYFIYAYYYPTRQNADIFKYFDDAKQIYKALPQHPLDFIQMILGINIDNQYFYENYFVYTEYWSKRLQDSLISTTSVIIRFNAITMLFSFGYFNVHTVFASFFSFIGQMGLCHFVENNLKKIHIGHVLVIFLIPSVIFWSSSVLKEFLLFFSIGILVYATDKLFFYTKNIKQKLWTIILIIIACYTLIFTKTYIFVLLLALLIPFVLTKKYQIKKTFVCYLCSIIVCAVISYCYLKLFLGKDIINFIVFRHNIMLNLALEEHAHITENHLLQADIFDIFSYLPIAFVNVLLRPFPFESFSPMMLLSEIEQLILEILTISILFLGFNKKIEQKNLFYFCLFFTLSNIIIIGLCSPIIGATVRYRSIFLPFLCLFFLLLCDEKTIKYRYHKIISFFKVKNK